MIMIVSLTVRFYQRNDSDFVCGNHSGVGIFEVLQITIYENHGKRGWKVWWKLTTDFLLSRIMHGFDKKKISEFEKLFREFLTFLENKIVDVIFWMILIERLLLLVSIFA